MTKQSIKDKLKIELDSRVVSVCFKWKIAYILSRDNKSKSLFLYTFLFDESTKAYPVMYLTFFL